jgi:hypothetical protein
MSAGDLIASMPTPSVPGGSAGTDDHKVGMIQDIVQQLRDDFRDRDELFSRIDTVLFQENEVAIPDNYRKTALEVKSPLAPHIANTVTAALSTNPPNVQFDPVAFGDPAQANSTLREKFFEAAWRRQEEEAQRPLFRPFMHALVTKGDGVLKTVERTKKAWSQYTRDSPNSPRTTKTACSTSRRRSGSAPCPTRWPPPTCPRTPSTTPRTRTA